MYSNSKTDYDFIGNAIKENRITFKELTEIYFNDKKFSKKSTTIQCDYYSLKKFSELEQYFISEITPNMINNILEAMDQSGLTIGYINKLRSIINKIFNFALEQEFLSINPVRKAKKIKRPDELKKEMQFWTLIQFESFSKVISEKDSRYYVLFNILYYMGCRKGEALALKWDDINFSQRTIRINKTIAQQLRGVSYKLTPPKTLNSNRTIKIPTKLYEILLVRYNTVKLDNSFSPTNFVLGGTNPLSLRYVGTKFKRYAILANVPIIRIHDLRHSHASLLINQGANIKAIASRLGDSVDTVLNVYTHLFHETEDELVSIIDMACEQV